jgi:signal transduction histidine kinase
VVRCDGNRGKSRRGVRRRTRRLSRWLLIGLFLLLVLVVLNAGLFVTYRQVRATIELELGQRLLAIANTTAAALVPAEIRALRDDPEDPAAARLQPVLQRILFDSDLGDLYLFDESYIQLISAGAATEPGYENPALDLHFGAATAAIAGVPATSDLYQVGQIYLKTAFAPIVDETGQVLAVVGVEGGTGFFSGLWQLRRQVLINALIGMVAIIALGALFFSLRRTQAIAERTLRETSALAAAGELAAILAHEIRNPLAIISARAERVQSKIEKGKSTEEVLQWFSAIPLEVDRLNGILTQYLSYARPVDMAAEAVALGTAMDGAFSFLEGDFKRKGYRLIRRDEAHRETLLAVAPAALHQILLNLLLNARDALGDGGEVTVDVETGAELLYLHLSDTGCGMSRDQQRRAFESFYTTKEHGSGLGLATVRSMVELYGGEISVESEPGKGSVFTLAIPLAQIQGSRKPETERSVDR